MHRYSLESKQLTRQEVMKYIFIFVLATIFIFSCQRVDDDNADDFESTGEIIGFDLTECACCGGFLTKFDEREEVFLFTEMPDNADFSIDITTQDYPIKIQANWTEDVSTFCTQFITIENIELVE